MMKLITQEMPHNESKSSDVDLVTNGNYIHRTKTICWYYAKLNPPVKYLRQNLFVI